MRRLRPMRRSARRRVSEEQDDRSLFGPVPVNQGSEQTELDDIFVPFVPVESSSFADELDDGQDTPPDEAESFGMVPADIVPAREGRRLRLRLPRLSGFRGHIRVRLNIVVWAGGLIAAGVFGTLLNQGRIKGELETWWPIILIALAGAWLLVALIRRQVAWFLGAAACTGVGVSFLLSTQDIAGFEETLLGIVLVTVGLGIVVRGFLLRQHVPT